MTAQRHPKQLSTFTESRRPPEDVANVGGTFLLKLYGAVRSTFPYGRDHSHTATHRAVRFSLPSSPHGPHPPQWKTATWLEPWYSPTITSQLLLFSIWYSVHYSMPLPFEPDTPDFHHITFIETLSNAFSRSTKARYNSFFLARCFSIICRTTKMASVVHFLGIKPNRISPTCTGDLIVISSTLSTIFRGCSRSLMALMKEPHSSESPFPLNWALRWYSSS